MESWEEENVRKHDPVIEARFLAKHRGLRWKDPDDDDKLFVVSETSVDFERGRCSCGWCLTATDQDGKMEAWKISLVVDKIGNTEQSSELNIKIVKSVDAAGVEIDEASCDAADA